MQEAVPSGSWEKLVEMLTFTFFSARTNLTKTL